MAEEKAEEVEVVKDELLTFVKENGIEIKINNHPDNIAKAKELGWKPKGKGK